MTDNEVNKAAEDIALGLAHPFKREYEIAVAAAAQGIRRGLQEAVDAERLKLALAQIDASFAHKSA